MVEDNHGLSYGYMRDELNYFVHKNDSKTVEFYKNKRIWDNSGIETLLTTKLPNYSKMNSSTNSIIESIYKAGLKLLDPLTPFDTYSIIVQEGVRLVHADDGLIVLKNKSTLATVYGSSPAAAQVIVRKKGYAYKSYRTKKAFVIGNEEFKYAHPQVERMGIKSAIFIPLSYRQKSIGVLIIRSYDKKSFSANELEIMKLFGSMASLAVRKTQLYAETKQALELRDAFISIASHELRTPLTAVSGYIQLLYSKLRGKQTQESKWIEQLYHENNRLTRLVSELLEINKVKAGQLQYTFREMSVVAAIEQVLAKHKLSSPDHAFTFTNKSKGSDSMIGDPEKIERALDNILQNAVKFSQSHSVIHITLRKSSKQFHIVIEDQGIGISKEHIQRIFQGFFKSGANTKQGMGVGLFLTKNIIEKHNGTITAQSELNKGTRIDIYLPELKK